MRLDKSRTQGACWLGEGICRLPRQGAEGTEALDGIEREAFAQRLPAQRGVAVLASHCGHERRRFRAAHAAEQREHHLLPAGANVASRLVEHHAVDQAIVAARLRHGGEAMQAQGNQSAINSHDLKGLA